VAGVALVGTPKVEVFGRKIGARGRGKRVGVIGVPEHQIAEVGVVVVGLCVELELSLAGREHCLAVLGLSRLALRYVDAAHGGGSGLGGRDAGNLVIHAREGSQKVADAFDAIRAA